MANKSIKKTDASVVTVEQLVAESGVSRQTLDNTPARVLTFLMGLGKSKPIWSALARRGYKKSDHAEGWALLHAASGFTASDDIRDDVDVAVRDAATEIDNLDEDVFRVVRATLGRAHPEQGRFVLKGLAASVGPQAVVGMKSLLGRLDQLEKGDQRKDTRKADAKALESLAERGLHAQERARLAALVAQAEAGATVAPDDDAEDPEVTYVRALVALRAWFLDWSEMAKVAVKRRDHLIRLGLAKRKVGAGAADDGEGESDGEPGGDPAGGGAAGTGGASAKTEPGGTASEPAV